MQISLSKPLPYVYDSVPTRFVLEDFQWLGGSMRTSQVLVVEGIAESEWRVASPSPVVKVTKKGS